MPVFWAIENPQFPKTGGELFFSKVLDYLKTQEGDRIILATKTDLSYIDRPRGWLRINLYFVSRFRCLPSKTTIVESASYYYAFFLANWLIKLYRKDIRVLISAHQTPDPLNKNRVNKMKWHIMLLLFLKSGDVITVNSNYLKEVLIKVFKVPGEQIHTVPPAAKIIGRKKVKVEKGRDDFVRILSVANIRRLKGQKVLVDAVNRLKKGKCEVYLVGGIKEKAYEDELHALIKKYGLDDCVNICGFLDGAQLKNAYSEADLFVLPSLYEAYGMVLHEAMAFGLPIVSSDVGGIPEIISDGSQGFLVPPGDPVMLAERIDELLANPRLREKMGERGRKRSSELPGWQDVCDQFRRAVLAASAGQ